MSKQTSILIRRHILSLKPREIFYRADLLRYGTEHVVDQNIYRLRQANKIVRLLKGVYMRRQPDGWLPSPEVISEIRAKMLGRLICEDAETATVKICNPDEELETLSFNTTGRGLSFQYQGKTIRFKETTGKKIALGETRIGKAINILWSMGPNLSLEETKWFLEKYLHSEERHEMRQQLSGLPPWLMERLKSILPDYNPIRYNGNEIELLAVDQYKNHGNGPTLTNFRSSHGTRTIQKMKESDEQIVASMLKPIDDLSTAQKKLLLELLFRKYWDDQVNNETSKNKLPLKSNAGFFTKLLTKAINDPQRELEQAYYDIQLNLIQLRQAIAQGYATAKYLNKQISKETERNNALLDRLSKFDAETERSFIEKIQAQIDDREKAILDVTEQAAEVDKNNEHLKKFLNEIQTYSGKVYTFKQMLHARFRAIAAYDQAKQLLEKSFSVNLDSELSKFEKLVVEAESRQNWPSASHASDSEVDLLSKSLPILERNSWILERVEELLKSFEKKNPNIKT